MSVFQPVLPVSLSNDLFFCLPLCLFSYVFLSLCRYLSLFLSSSISLPLSRYMSHCLSFCLSLPLSSYRSHCLSVCLSLSRLGSRVQQDSQEPMRIQISAGHIRYTNSLRQDYHGCSSEHEWPLNVSGSDLQAATLSLKTNITPTFRPSLKDGGKKGAV